MLYNKHLALLSYLTVCIVWGSTYLAIRVGVTDMPFIMFVGIRFTVAGFLILLISRLCRWDFPTRWQDYRTIIFVGLLLLFVSNGLISWAQQYLESSFSALLIASVPLFMAAVDNLLPGGQRVGYLGWIGLIVGFVGVAVLVSPQITFSGYSFPATIAVLLAAAVWSVGSIYLRRNPIKGGLMPNVGIQMLTAGALFLVLAVFSGNFSLAEISLNGFTALLYLIFIGSILAYSAFYYMIKVVPAAKAGTYAYINPVVAMFLGSLILKEGISMQEIMAAAVIIGGVILVQASVVNSRSNVSS